MAISTSCDTLKHLLLATFVKLWLIAIQRTERNVYAQVAKHSHLFVIVVHVSHPAEQRTIDNL